MIVKKSPEEIEQMAAAGKIHARALNMLAGKARAGVSTLDLDAAAARFLRSQGADASFLGYRGFPGSICASPNSMIVHGIPGPEPLKRGDLLSIDLGVTLNGWVVDGAVTVAVGPATAIADKLLSATRDALTDAVEQCRVGNHLGDIGHAVQSRVEKQGLAVVKALVGHGVGRSMHEDPQIANYGDPGTGVELAEGMVLAIEPMITTGSDDIRMGDDGWAVFTVDGSLAAHFEHTVAITAEGPRILTPWHLEDSERRAA
ncbi:MAG: type I methionyl aminopeptidase [Thermoleophilaceae bacterium]|nr:type I methionyl aminopeptidase [Thermoleophilaceae bacterium]